MIPLLRTRVKMCGITNTGDAIAAVNAGADALGLVFYPPSPRNLDIDQARFISSKIPAFVTRVALFVNPEKQFVEDVILRAEIDCLQFHGDESAEFCEQFKKPYIKAIRMRADTDLKQLCQTYSTSQGLLLDTYKKGVPGGTGESFNWDLLKPYQGKLSKPIILAGGLTSENVAEAIDSVAPWAVDVSGGIETTPGKKDEQRIQSFIENVNACNVNA